MSTDPTPDAAEPVAEPVAIPATDAPDGTAPTAEDYAKLESAIRTVMTADETTKSSEDFVDDEHQGEPEQSTADDDAGDISKARRQAANYRTQLREAQAERDQLRDSSAAQLRAFIDWRAANHPGGAVDPALLDAAGIDVAKLADDSGKLDMTAVDDFIAAAAQRFSVKRAFTVNRAQGISADPGSRPSLADAFKRK